jgi:hypothetical protein
MAFAFHDGERAVQARAGESAVALCNASVITDTVIAGARTLVKPLRAGDSTILLDALTAMGDETNIVVAPTGLSPWQNKIVSSNSVESIKSITTDHVWDVAVYPGQVLYEASSTVLTTTFTADNMSKSLTTDVATSIVAGDTVYILPVSAEPACFARVVAKTPENLEMLSVTNSNVQLGVALDAGDSVWLAGNTGTFLVGAANVTAQNSAGMWQAIKGAPASATLTTTNGLIRNITGDYK